MKKTRVGTYEYMSPEIANNTQYNEKIDVWCLGILLYETLHGHPPFKATNIQQIKNIINQPIRVSNKFEGLKHLFRNLLKRNWQNRISLE